MIVSQMVRDQLANLAAQWNADSARKAGITATSRYNLLVATFNALAGIEFFGEGVLPETVQPDIETYLPEYGFNDVGAVATAHIEDWGATWPVAFAT